MALSLSFAQIASPRRQVRRLAHPSYGVEVFSAGPESTLLATAYQDRLGSYSRLYVKGPDAPGAVDVVGG